MRVYCYTVGYITLKLWAIVVRSLNFKYRVNFPNRSNRCLYLTGRLQLRNTVLYFDYIYLLGHSRVLKLTILFIITLYHIHSQKVKYGSDFFWRVIASQICMCAAKPDINIKYWLAIARQEKKINTLLDDNGITLLILAPWS